MGKNQSPAQKITNHYGLPFVEGTLPFKRNGSARIELGIQAKKIFLLGMTDTGKAHSWTDLRGGYSRRYFIGDNLGAIRLDYADGTTQTFPLVLGESLWWGQIFYDFPEPFLSDAQFRRALAKSLRLYPPAPMKDGNYIAVIVPKNCRIKDIVVQNSPAKIGVPVIDGLTFELADNEKFSNGIALPQVTFSRDFAKFANEKPLYPSGANENEIQARLENLKRSFYTSDENFKRNIPVQIPRDYSGPSVSFHGNIYARILENAFYANVQDMRDKVTADGMYHTSTKGAPNWGIYSGFGSFTTNIGTYYGQSWTRDMGRSLQELTDLDYTNEALRCADYCLRTARLWENPSNRFDGQLFPPHWGRIANIPQSWCVFENDGHGLVTMFLYQLWQRLPSANPPSPPWGRGIEGEGENNIAPSLSIHGEQYTDRDAWLRARWPDVKAAGDWILWQFVHPKISGATNGILHTTSESAGMVGYSVYPDYTCMAALRVLAKMADSIGKTNSAAQWTKRADEMQAAMTSQYIVHDPKYGRVWTLAHAGYPNRSTVLGPLILSADYRGFAPEDDDSNWHSVNEAAYQRLVDKYRPFGFYGQAMGYGQGFVTQAALLLDRMRDATTMLDWAAKEIYNPHFNSFIAPEGSDIDPTGRYWYRLGDLGNGVQEAEIVKMLRLVIGVDDTQPSRLRFYPRMPYDWNKIAVAKYPVLFDNAGKIETTHLRYNLERTRNGMKLKISADQDLGPVGMRLGPFQTPPELSSIRVNGQIPSVATIERSGDSWWVKFTMPIVAVGVRPL